jgi:cytochrome c oxidase subunit 1
MSSDAITIPALQIQEKPWVDLLHEWVTTVDHKRLGILYIVYALVFLVFGGI